MRQEAVGSRDACEGTCLWSPRSLKGRPGTALPARAMFCVNRGSPGSSRFSGPSLCIHRHGGSGLLLLEGKPLKHAASGQGKDSTEGGGTQNNRGGIHGHFQGMRDTQPLLTTDTGVLRGVSVAEPQGSTQGCFLVFVLGSAISVAWLSFLNFQVFVHLIIPSVLLGCSPKP